MRTIRRRRGIIVVGIGSLVFPIPAAIATTIVAESAVQINVHTLHQHTCAHAHQVWFIKKRAARWLWAK